MRSVAYKTDVAILKSVQMLGGAGKEGMCSACVFCLASYSQEDTCTLWCYPKLPENRWCLWHSLESLPTHTCLWSSTFHGSPPSRLSPPVVWLHAPLHPSIPSSIYRSHSSVKVNCFPSTKYPLKFLTSLFIQCWECSLPFLYTLPGL